MSATDFLAAMQTLVAELPPNHPLGPFELASANDSVDREGEAEALYRLALDGDIESPLRRRATIQLASAQRILGSRSTATAC